MRPALVYSSVRGRMQWPGIELLFERPESAIRTLHIASLSYGQ
jgi:hypothetical protein